MPPTSDPEWSAAGLIRQPIGDYIPTNVHTAQRMKSDYGFSKQACLSNVRGVPGRKDFVDLLHIDWLCNEPLDQAHVLGVWQRGWLFRSAKPGYFVWVDAHQGALGFVRCVARVGGVADGWLAQSETVDVSDEDVPIR